MPFAALPFAASPVVPIAAAERILGLSEADPASLQPWERAPEGRYYRRYWADNKRFLGLAADLAARFPADGGEAIATAIRRRLRHLSAADSVAVELHLAAVGLLDRDPADLAQRVVQSAAGDDLGGRGELLLEALSRIEHLPAEDRADLLRQAVAVARRTTTFVASNPFAAVVEALAASEVGSVDELVELVGRAVELKIHDWSGWDRALRSAGRSLSRLAAQQGEAAVDEAVWRLEQYQREFRELTALLRLAGAEGLPPAGAVGQARAALAEARRVRPSEEAARLELGAVDRLLRLGSDGAAGELATSVTRVRTFRGRAQSVGLLEAAALLAERDPGHGRDLAEALALADRIRDTDGRWLAWLLIATAPATDPPVAEQCLEQALRASRLWLIRPAPLDVLVPLTNHLLAGLPRQTRHPAAGRLVRLTAAAVAGRLTGDRFAAEFMTLGRELAEPDAVAALAAAIEPLEVTWWRLPLLALLADATAAWLHRLGGEPETSGPERPLLG